jgi:hypothetical protein
LFYNLKTLTFAMQRHRRLNNGRYTPPCALFFLYIKKNLQRYKKNLTYPNKVIHIGKKNVNNFFIDYLE